MTGKKVIPENMVVVPHFEEFTSVNARATNHSRAFGELCLVERAFIEVNSSKLGTTTMNDFVVSHYHLCKISA